MTEPLISAHNLSLVAYATSAPAVAVMELKNYGGDTDLVVGGEERDLEAEVKQITHAIRMAAYNTQTTLARALHGHYARAEDEAYALIREALTTSGDIIPAHGELLIHLDPLTAPRRTRALAALCDQLTQAQTRYPGTELILRYQVKGRPRPA